MDGVEATWRVRYGQPAHAGDCVDLLSRGYPFFPAIKGRGVIVFAQRCGTGELADAVRAAARGGAVIHPRCGHTV
jgi:hypothetical protein